MNQVITLDRLTIMEQINKLDGLIIVDQVTVLDGLIIMDQIRWKINITNCFGLELYI